MYRRYKITQSEVLYGMLFAYWSNLIFSSKIIDKTWFLKTLINFMINLLYSCPWVSFVFLSQGRRGSGVGGGLPCRRGGSLERGWPGGGGPWGWPGSRFRRCNSSSYWSISLFPGQDKFTPFLNKDLKGIFKFWKRPLCPKSMFTWQFTCWVIKKNRYF